MYNLIIYNVQFLLIHVPDTVLYRWHLWPYSLQIKQKKLNNRRIITFFCTKKRIFAT